VDAATVTCAEDAASIVSEFSIQRVIHSVRINPQFNSI
jgi:hypothetical protein